MNGKGIPGGEHALWGIFKEQGIEGIAAQFNYTLPVFKAKVGETVEFHVINHAWSLNSRRVDRLRIKNISIFNHRSKRTNILMP